MGWYYHPEANNAIFSTVMNMHIKKNTRNWRDFKFLYDTINNRCTLEDQKNLWNTEFLQFSEEKWDIKIPKKYEYAASLGARQRKCCYTKKLKK